MSEPHAHVVGVIQARLGSRRLPGKVLEDVAGKPLLSRVVARARAAATLDEVVLATTVEGTDDPVAAHGVSEGVRVFRGSVDDVLDRFARVAEESGATIVVRLTADDPFKDPAVIDEVCSRILAEPTLDYASNTIRPTFPLGVDVEAIGAQALRRAAAEATSDWDREHVTQYILRRPHLFRVASVEQAVDLSHVRCTVDFEEDLALATAIYERFAPAEIFPTADVIRLIQEDEEIAELHRRALARTSIRPAP